MEISLRKNAPRAFFLAVPREGGFLFKYSFLIKIFDFYQEGAAVSVVLLQQSAAKAVS